MPEILAAVPPRLKKEYAALNQALDGLIPVQTEENLLIATWNIRKFGGLTRSWAPEGDYTPKRDFRALKYIIEILRRFDIVAVQEVIGDLRALRDTMNYLHPDWSFLMTDVSIGDAGNHERLAFLFNSTRVMLSGLACELVIPPEAFRKGDSKWTLDKQFARTPYAVSFRAGNDTFILVTAHIDYGDSAGDRVNELKDIATWMRDWAERTNRFHQNLLLLGDFNIDRRGDELWEAFSSSGLKVPGDLNLVKRSIFIDEGDDPQSEKFYDQVAWFADDQGKARLNMPYRRGGGFDFLPYVYPEGGLSKRSISHRVSDHYPLWVEFGRRC